MLVGKNISKSYGDNHILKNIDIKVKPGEIVAVIGPSGSGKSTLLRSLSLLDPPDSGIVTVDGDAYVYPSKNSSQVLAPPWPKVTLVFQQLFLWPHLTVRGNMELPLKYMDKDLRDAKIEELIDHYILSEFIDRFPNEISIGQRQRVAIARSISLDPTYLLLDEITSALDVENIEGVLYHLQNYASNGMAIVLVTHLIGFAKRAATQMIFMEDGRIIEQGKSHRLVAPQTDQLGKFLSLIEVAGDKRFVVETQTESLTETSLEAKAIVRHLREQLATNNEIITDEEVRYIDRLPLIDKVRDLLTEEDIPWLMKLAQSSNEFVAGMMCSLLHNFILVKPEIINLFEELWVNASPYLRNRLMWRLLEVEEVAEKWHDEFTKFIFSEWPVFRDFNLRFYSDNAYAEILERMIDKPKYKKWIYLCSVPEVVDNPVAARKILELGMCMDLPHMREIATKLIQEFWPRDDSFGPRRAAMPVERGSADFSARAVLVALREGVQISEADADYLNRRPFIDVLRKKVKRSDLNQWVMKGASSNLVEYAGLCLSLLRKFDTEPEVSEFLKERWKSAPPFIKAHIMWRILDDKYLHSDWHKEIFNFVLEYPSEFHNASLKFLGTPENIVDKARESYENPISPESKKWSYLCRVAGVSAHPQEAKNFIQSASNGEDKFRNYVAQTLLNRHYPD